MAEDNDISIPVGLDPNDALIDIEEAERRQNYYRCPVCHEYLAVRKGNIRVHYFAHYPRGADSPDCRLRSEGGLIEWIREYRLAPEEKLTRAHKMRMVLLKEQYSDYYDLYGIVPSFSKEDFKDDEELRKTMGALVISGDSIDKTVYPEAFHPNESEVRIRLKSDKVEHKVCISSVVKKEPIVGIWTAPGLHAGDVFVGNKERAEKVKNSIPLREGDVIYIVYNKNEPGPDFPYDSIPVGNHEIISFEIRKEFEDKIRELLPKATLEKSSFTVDLLLPVELNPQIVGPVEGLPHSEVLIAVTPPPERNPEFEIVSVPVSSSPIVPLPATAPGEPRYYLTKFPDRGSKKMSIHYLDRHSFIHFYSTQDKQPETTWTLTCDSDIHINLLSKYNNNILYPWLDENVELEKPDESSIGQLIRFSGPEALRVHIESKANTRSEEKRTTTLLGSASKQIQLDYDLGFRSFTIRYGLLGKTTITLIKPKKLMDILTEDEIAQRIRINRINPSDKINNGLLRQIIGESDAEIPGGLRKRVRHIMGRMRRGEI